jgi:O-antigen ligase
MRTDREHASASRPLFIGYLALLLWSPLPLGSNRPWAWAIVELWVFVLAISWLVGFALGKLHRTAALRGAWPALVCGALWLGFVWLQLAPLPLDAIKALSPEAARWHAAAAWPVDSGWAPLTIDRYATLDGALKSAAYFTFFALSLALLDRSERIAATAYALVCSGILQAMYGGLWALGPEFGSRAHGSFANPNHYAGYLVMCLSVGLGVLIANLRGDVSGTWTQFLRNLISWVLSSRMQLRLALIVMVIALVLSRSRMGNTAFFASLLVTSGIGLALSKRATRSMVLLIASLIVIDILIIGAYFGVARIVERIERTDLETEERGNVAAYAFGAWKDYPVFGSGLGSFHVVFPRYRGQDVTELYTHAHNDYLQFAVETGIVGLALLGLLVGMSFLAALRAQYLRRDPLMRGISFGSMMGIIALMIHSAVDFNLQIPANAMTFMLVLSLAWISLYHGRAADNRGKTTGRDQVP